MKRYIVFGFSEYYPGGGWHDLIGSFDTIEEAKEAQKDEQISQIVDLFAGKEIFSRYKTAISEAA